VIAFDEPLAGRYASYAFAALEREYPNHLTHFLNGSEDVRPPRALHPAFYGCLDWHSAVHNHWLLARLLHVFPGAPFGKRARALLAKHITSETIARERDYFAAPGREIFERPYGWAWLLKLAGELAQLARGHRAAERWSRALSPLAEWIAQRLAEYLTRAEYPVRAGSHGNSAFALVLAHDYAAVLQHRALAQAIARAAALWFGADRRYPAEYEPSGDDFLSPGLCEALLMTCTLPACDFADWWDAFSPHAAVLTRWLTPVRVSDPTDPKIVHLHGLNLSRAWCWRRLSPHVPDPLRDAAGVAVEASLAASLGAATVGDYVGTHWLASFALLALTEPVDATT
jgi:Protein of unknown function (DUF2891)